MTNSKDTSKSTAKTTAKDTGKLVPTEPATAELPETVERADALRREQEKLMEGEAREAESTRDAAPRS